MNLMENILKIKWGNYFMKNKKVDYFIIFALILSLGGSIKYLISYINNKQTIDLVACLIISTTFAALIISLIIVKIIKNKNK